MHDLPLITTVAAAFSAAWLLGLLTQRCGLSPIVGYLVAGICIGPHTPGFVGDIAIAQQLAEVGVILLMFGVGLHFHAKDLLAVKRIAIPGALIQCLATTVFAVALLAAFDIPLKTGAVIGMAMAVSSTVVLIRVLMDADVLESPQGHAAVGWLLVQDVFTVILLVLIPVLGEAPADHGEAGHSFWVSLAFALLKLFAFVGIILVAGVRVIPWALVRVARLRSRELFTLTVLVFSIAIAAASYVFFGASMALGAFLGGMVVALSPASHQAAADALPMRDAFAVLFFVSVGMIFDPAFLLNEPLLVLAALAIVMVAKPLVTLAIVATLGYSAKVSLTAAIGLAQIGEFSFIISDLAKRHGLMSDDGHNLLVACAILSISLNPILFHMLPAAETRLRRHPFLWRMINGKAERRAQNENVAAAAELAAPERTAGRLAILIGFGPVGRAVHRLLGDAKLHTVVIDMNMDTVSALNASGQVAIFGDASHEGILEQAGVRRASYVIVTLPHASGREAVIIAVKSMNPAARILVRARYLREREFLDRADVAGAVYEEAEAAVALARLVLADTGVNRKAADAKINDLRLQLIIESIGSLRKQPLQILMVPWSRVRWLHKSATRESVLARVAQEQFARWPVVDHETGRADGYITVKDLFAPGSDPDWRNHIQPLAAIEADESIESALTKMQSGHAPLYLVRQNEHPAGLITLADVIKEVVGQKGDNASGKEKHSLLNCLVLGPDILDLATASRDCVIEELVATIPPHRLPSHLDTKEITRLALLREEELSTDLGMGVAVPHARCPMLTEPLIVFGRSADGIMFTPDSAELVHLVFLIVTPEEDPSAQLQLLSQLLRICGKQEARKALMRAQSTQETINILTGVE